MSYLATNALAREVNKTDTPVVVRNERDVLINLLKEMNARINGLEEEIVATKKHNPTNRAAVERMDAQYKHLWNLRSWLLHECDRMDDPK